MRNVVKETPDSPPYRSAEEFPRGALVRSESGSYAIIAEHDGKKLIVFFSDGSTLEAVGRLSQFRSVSGVNIRNEAA